MVSRRVNPRGLVYCEEWRIEGPDAASREGEDILSPAIQMGRYDAQGNDDDLQAWYAQEHTWQNSRAISLVITGVLGRADM